MILRINNEYVTLDIIDCFVDMSKQEYKYVDPFGEYIGVGVENKDNIVTHVESYSPSRLIEAFEKKDSNDFLNLLE